MEERTVIILNSPERHRKELQKNFVYWQQKHVLSVIYTNFYKMIAEHLTKSVKGHIVELGSGIGQITKVIPSCVRTDIFDSPWVDQVENAYSLTFSDNSVSNLILFDVFHHLRFPGSALREFYRVLAPGGRIIIFEPCISVLGNIIFGFFHHEPLGLLKPIDWFAPEEWKPEEIDYYAAQANAARIFLRKKHNRLLKNWNIVSVNRLSAISYVASGGYSKPQLYPDALFPIMRLADRFCDFFPNLFATRLLVAIEKS